MELSIFIAKIISLIYLAAGIGALSKTMNFERMVQSFQDSPALTYMTGFITLIIGMLLIEHHNIWTQNWQVLITIMGWAATIKGFMFIAFPNQLGAFKGMYKNHTLWGILMIIIALIFGYFGFLG